VDLWVRSPFGVIGALRGLDAEKAENPSTPCTILSMGSKWPFQFSLWYKLRGAEPLTLLFQSLVSWDGTGLSLPLILNLTLLHCP
jgi:hypothetical protein